MQTLLPSILLLTSHPGPASHFADFADVLSEKKISYTIVAKDAAQAPLSKKGATYLEELPENLSDYTSILIDVGSEIPTELEDKNVLVYYDNPEGFVPGGYSETAAKVIAKAQTILFANANLASKPISDGNQHPIDCSGKTKIGLGYSSFPQQVENIQKMRTHETREAFLRKHGLVDEGQKIAIYFGGANAVYSTKALPHFLGLLNEIDIDGTLFFHQKHPRDTTTDSHEKLLLSTVSFDEALVVADYALYYQTSANALFTLLEIPTIQVGHETFSDLLVENALCLSVTEGPALKEALSLTETPDPAEILPLIGYSKEWPKILLKALSTAD